MRGMHVARPPKILPEIVSDEAQRTHQCSIVSLAGTDRPPTHPPIINLQSFTAEINAYEVVWCCILTMSNTAQATNLLLPPSHLTSEPNLHTMHLGRTISLSNADASSPLP